MGRRKKRNNKIRSNFGGSYKKPSRSSRRKKSFIEILELHTRTLRERIILSAFAIGTIGVAVIVFFAVIFSLTLPDVSDAENITGTESTVIYDRDGKVLHTVYAEEDREVVKSENIPDVVKLATVAIEDDKFYSHNGFDVPALVKAVLSEVGIGKRRGGSTITQQFIKNAVLSSQRTYTRKLQELVLAVQLEKHYNKDQIITMYLNRVPYGGTAYGIQKASNIFFNKETTELGTVEAAILASLPNAPTFYSPYGDNKHSSLNVEFTPEEAEKIDDAGDLEDSEYTIGLLGKEFTLADGSTLYIPGRVDSVLVRMENLNFITEEEKDEAVAQAMNYEFHEYTPPLKDSYHFVMYVKGLLEEKYGKDLVENGGLKVTTTLNSGLQSTAQNIVNERSATYESRFSANNASLLTVDPTTGEVLAMVGNSQKDGVLTDYNNITTSPKQVGSTMKPLVYSAGFANGLPSPGSTIFDVPMKAVGGKFRNNFDGKFMGPISIRTALAQSRNIPALKMYTVAGGQEQIIEYVEKMGITSLDPDYDYGDSLALGSASIPMIELVQAYSVFPNEGKLVEINPILKVETSSGEVLEDNTERNNLLANAEEVITPEEAFMINNILSDQSVNFGDLQALPGNRPVATKTGTSTKSNGNPSDLWTVGYTKQKLTAVWVGNTNGDEIAANGTGYGAAMPIWNSFMVEATKDDSVVGFEKPATIQSYRFSKLSGDLPSSSTPANMTAEDFFMPNAEPTTVDSSYFKATVDVRNNKSTNQYCPTLYVKEVTFWKHTESEKYSPEGIQSQRHNEILAWFNGLDEAGRNELNLGENVVIGFPIDELSDNCKRSLYERSRSIEITNLSDGDGVPTGAQPVEVSASAASGIEKIEYYLNDSVQYTYQESVGGSYNGNVRISPAFPEGRELTIRVVLYDKYGYVEEDSIQVYVGEGKNKPSLSDFLDTTGGGNNSEDSNDEDQQVSDDITSGVDPIIDFDQSPGSIVIE